jgi:hypothetical protein
VDWGQSFVDTDGSFYCGTTPEQKQTAAKVSRSADLWLYLTDVHPRTSREFQAHGGLYPAHNLVKKDWPDAAALGIAPGKNVSPEITAPLHAIVAGKPAGLIVPRHVFFQDYNGGRPVPCFSFRDVEETFGVRKLDPVAFLDGAVQYVINAKHMFSGALLQSTEWMNSPWSRELRESEAACGVPSIEMNVFTLLKEKYGQGEGLVINHTGVVMGICIYQTASGIKQIFPKAEVNIIADGATHLLTPHLGFSEQRAADQALHAMCQQVGVNYLHSRDL